MDLKLDVERIIKDDYCVQHNPETQTVSFAGALSLNGAAAFKPIADLLDAALETTANQLTLDLSALEFLNSSGINMISKFVIKVRSQKGKQLMIRSSSSMIWQARSVKNFQRLMPTAILEWV